MDKKTINSLYQLNKKFYQTVAEPFDSSRQKAWTGWERALTEIQQRLPLEKPLRILDLGCGNGRWGKFFLEKTHHTQTTYVGVDENNALLHAASRTLIPLAPILELHCQDLMTFISTMTKQKAARFDLIVLFGVWHHLPGYQERTQLLAQLAKLLEPNGLLMISCWRFLRSPSLKTRLVDPTTLGYQMTQLEKGDCFLDWHLGTTAVRYCHDTAVSELASKPERVALELVSTFSADGKTRNLNDYYLFTPKIHLAVS